MQNAMINLHTMTTMIYSCIVFPGRSEVTLSQVPNQVRLGHERLPRQQIADFRTRYVVKSKYTLAAHLYFSGGLAWTAALDLSEMAFNDVPVDE